MNKARFIGKKVFQYIMSIFMLVSIPCFTLYAEPIEPILSKNELDSLLNKIDKFKQDTNLVVSLLSIANYYLINDIEKSDPYIKKALALSEKLKYKNGQIKSLCYQAVFLSSTLKDTLPAVKAIEKAIFISEKEGDYEMEAYSWYTRGLWLSNDNVNLAEKYYTKSRALYKRAGNNILEAFVLKCIADLHLYQNRLKLSLSELIDALRILQEVEYKKLHYTYDLIGTVYRLMGNYESALRYSLLTLKSAKETNDTIDIPLFYRRVGQVFKEINHYSEAIKYFEIVLQKALTDGGKYRYLRFAASNIAILLTQSGEAKKALEFYQKTVLLRPVKYGSSDYCIDCQTLGDIYFSLKQYDKAEKYYVEMLNLNEETYNNDYFNLASYIKIANFYIGRGKFQKAKEYIVKELEQQTLKSLSDMAIIHWQQFKVDSAEGNYISAIKHYQTYKSLNDSIFNDKKINQIASLNIQFETKIKEQNIVSLNAQNKQQQAILNQREFERNVFIAGAIVLSLLLWLSINRYRIKQKTNAKLHEQQGIINNKNEILKSLIKEKEELIISKDKLIIEKEWLIKEVHHRVKNNLQMICTLLYTQASYLKDNNALAAINEAQQRIQAVSLIHQKLYQSANLQLVNMKNYVHELVDNLKDNFDVSKKIEFILKVDSFDMDISKAIPIGLILNEAITNCLKYAFMEDSRKVITIQLQSTCDQTIVLSVRDNGRGLLDELSILKSNSLGINMMKGLSRQINAEFSIKNDNGTVVTVLIKESKD